MKVPGNIAYHFKCKKNKLLPEYFNDYILNQNISSYLIEDIEKIKKLYKNSKIKIQTIDKGAGSRLSLNKKHKERTLSAILNGSATKRKYGMLINKIVKHFEIKNILELGTSIGIGTAYLHGNKNINKIISIDACTNCQEYAEKNLKSLKLTNYQLINCDFDKLFENNLLKQEKFDLFYIDGNHKGEKTISYYNYLNDKHAQEKSIFIFDDINWSVDMYNAWKKICNENINNSCIIDTFQMGIIFKNYNNLPKSYFRVNFTK